MIIEYVNYWGLGQMPHLRIGVNTKNVDKVRSVVARILFIPARRLPYTVYDESAGMTFVSIDLCYEPLGVAIQELAKIEKQER
jgi:hypothetical protein